MEAAMDGRVRIEIALRAAKVARRALDMLDNGDSFVLKVELKALDEAMGDLVRSVVAAIRAESQTTAPNTASRATRTAGGGVA